MNFLSVHIQASALQVTVLVAVVRPDTAPSHGDSAVRPDTAPSHGMAALSVEQV